MIIYATLRAFRPSIKSLKILSRTGRKSEGKRGVSGGVWECGKPVGFSIISMPQSEGAALWLPLSPLPARRRSPPQRIFFLLLFLLEVIALFIERRKGKPEESKTVRQWALLGRIPIDAMKPSYIWETQTDGPVTVYYHEDNTREMTREERADFLADQKGYGQRYLQLIIQEKRRLKRKRDGVE